MNADNPSIRRLDDWSGDRLREIADEYDTPLYVLDLDRVRENCRRIAAAFPDAEPMYAAKANTVRPVLETVADEGFGVECASAGETLRALDAGVSDDRVHYTAVNPPARDLDLVVERWNKDAPELTITAGAADTVDRLAERGFDGRLCVRIHPAVGAGHHENVATGNDATFGVPHDRAGALLDHAADRGMNVIGIHAHAGSGITNDDLDAHRALVERLAEVARGRSDVSVIDVGGGFGVPYRPDEEPLDVDAVADATRDALADVDATLAVEPGRYLVADAGVLLTHVTTVKPTPAETVVGTDAGMTDLLRPAMYDAYHHVRSLAPDADERAVERVTLAGPICEGSDVLGRDRPLPDPERGDLLAVGNAGAYGYEMASHYNSRPRPASVVIEDGDVRLARRRETLADVTAVEVHDDE